MADESRFDFCPICGALARDGVCQSCGHKDQRVLKEMEAAKQVQTMGQPMYAQQPIYNQQVYTGQQPTYGQQPMQNAQQPVYNQQVYTGQQPMYGQQPMQNAQQPVYNQPYFGQPAYNAIPSAEPPKKSNLWVVVLILALVLLMTIVVIVIGVISIKNAGGNHRTEDVMGEDYEDDWFSDDEEENDFPGSGETGNATEESDSDDTDSEEPTIDLEDYVHDKYDVTQANLSEAGQDTSLPYYSGPYNAVADTLSYEVSFVTEMFYAEDKPVYITVEYPQIASGLEEYREYINDVLQYEYEYYETLFTEEFAPLMEAEDDMYNCYVDSYVTYMDEDILSIVFKEELYMQLDNEMFSMLDFYCVNVDLKSGMVMENTEILQLDESFAVDFRQREINENGDAALTKFTDREILEMLQDSSRLVVFYTPYGMEVGLNLEDIIVYVMYDDYTSFLNSY